MTESQVTLAVIMYGVVIIAAGVVLGAKLFG